MRDRRRRDRRERRGAVLGAHAGQASLLRHPMAEGVAVERFRRTPGEKRMRQHARHRGLVDLARRGGTPLVVLRLPGAQADEIVDQRIAGPGVEGDEVGLAVDEGHVGDAAEIEHADGMRRA